MKNGHAFRFAIVGGYSGKVLTAGEMDEPLEFGEFGNGAVIVLDESRNALETAQNVAEFFAGESCGKCAPCRGGTSSMPLLLAEIKAGRKTGGARALIRRLSNAMRDTSLCGLGQTAPNVVEELIDKYPHDFMDSGKRRPRSI